MGKTFHKERLRIRHICGIIKEVDTNGFSDNF